MGSGISYSGLLSYNDVAITCVFSLVLDLQFEQLQFICFQPHTHLLASTIASIRTSFFNFKLINNNLKRDDMYETLGVMQHNLYV
jgi:hypothetical protein